MTSINRTKGGGEGERGFLADYQVGAGWPSLDDLQKSTLEFHGIP